MKEPKLDAITETDGGKREDLLQVAREANGKSMVGLSRTKQKALRRKQDRNHRSQYLLQ